jgi:SAM-dependent methyltransferase
MATAWDDPEFVRAWNETYGLEMQNAPIRPGLIFPLLAQKTGGFAGLDLADLGCGNGNLIKYFSGAAFKSWTGVDGGGAVIDSARASVTDPRVNFVHADLTEKLPLPDNSADAVTAVFVVEELSAARLKDFFANAARILRPGGRAYIFTNHPSNALVQDLEAVRNGGVNKKFEGHKGYFDRDPSTYALSVLNQGQGFTTKAVYNHKTMGDIVTAAAQAGLAVDEMREVPDRIITLADWENHQPKQGDIPRFLYLELSRR